MGSASYVLHAGKQILYVDLTGCSSAELAPVVAEAERLIASHKPETALVLTNVTQTQLNKDSTTVMREYAAHNTPYVKASAICGVEGLKQVVLRAIQSLSGRRISTFETVDQAMEWLSVQ